jgi:hypothetical protein
MYTTLRFGFACTVVLPGTGEVTTVIGSRRTTGAPSGAISPG